MLMPCTGFMIDRRPPIDYFAAAPLICPRGGTGTVRPACEGRAAGV